MVLLTFVWKCFQDRNFHGVVVGLYEQSIESWVGLHCHMLIQPRFSKKTSHFRKQNSISELLLLDYNYRVANEQVLWCSGYHVCFTRRRSRVRSSSEPFPTFFITCTNIDFDCNFLRR